MKGEVNRAEAHQSKGGLIPLFISTLEWLRRNGAKMGELTDQNLQKGLEKRDIYNRIVIKIVRSDVLISG